MHTENTRSRQAGVGLIELMVSVLVLSIGLVALARLQIELVRGAADSRARSAAVALAEQKLEDLRSYGVVNGAGAWTTTNAQDPTFDMAWSYIDDNAGGRILSRTEEIEGVNYTLSWAVSDIAYTTSLGPAPGLPTDYKDVTVTVAWEDADADTPTQQVQLTGTIMGIPPGNVIAASEPVLARPNGPEVLYTPGEAPEIISVPIDVGDGARRETTKPLPSIKKTADSTMVTFDVVNYATNTNIVQRLEEFITITCACTFAGNGPARTPAKVVLVGSLPRDQPGKVVLSKPIGVVANAQQPPLCDICCRDHHDYADGTGTYRFNPDHEVPHKHYRKTNLTSEVTSGAYDEACRLKRVNGVFQVFEDWHLRALTVVPKSDLEDNPDKTEEYVQAVQDFIVDYADVKANGGTVPTSVDFTPSPVALDPNAKQLLARAIYIDNMPSDLLAKIRLILNDADTSNDVSVLSLVPFFEVHLTKLADWISRDTAKTKAKVTSNAIPDQNNVVDDGTVDGAGSVYSRGLAQPQTGATAGDTLIIASARNHNTGITNTAPINPGEDEGHAITGTEPLGPYYYSGTDPESPPAEHKDGSITVSVGGGISISGSFQTAAGSPKEPQGSKIGDPQGTNGAVCEGDGASTTGIESYTCVVPPSWTGTITFLSSAGYSFCDTDSPACTPETALASGTWAPPTTPVTTSITQDIWVYRP